MATCNWPISATQHITFEIYPLETNWNAVAGVYIFAKPLPENKWQALYVGVTEDFSRRLPDHEMRLLAVRNGATHIHALVENSDQQRLAIESALIRFLQPPLNTQGR